MYTPVIPRFVDHATGDSNRLPDAEVTELQDQFNCNMCDGNDETWFDEEMPISHVTIIDEDEFFNRYFGENYDR